MVSKNLSLSQSFAKFHLNQYWSRIWTPDPAPLDLTTRETSNAGNIYFPLEVFT